MSRLQIPVKHNKRLKQTLRIDFCVQSKTPILLRDRNLHVKPHLPISGYRGNRNMYDTIQRSFYLGANVAFRVSDGKQPCNMCLQPQTAKAQKTFQSNTRIEIFCLYYNWWKTYHASKKISAPNCYPIYVPLHESKQDVPTLKATNTNAEIFYLSLWIIPHLIINSLLMDKGPQFENKFLLFLSNFIGEDNMTSTTDHVQVSKHA